MLNPEKIKQDFPILSREINGRPLTYLDNGATSQRPLQVIEAMNEVQARHNANVHRGIYTISEEATAMYEGAREKVRAFINAKSTQEIVFTRNATESINIVALTWARQNLKENDIVVTTEMEHHSNIVPWQLLKKERGIDLRFLPADPVSGKLQLDDLAKTIPENTKLVCVGHMSNLLGTIHPLDIIIKRVHDVGAKVLVDGCQAAPHLPVDVQKLDADFYVFSAHKMLGPTGIGVLWARQEILEKTEPIIGGGDMIKTVTKDGATWNDLPWKFEAGTPNVVGVVGLGAAIDYLTELGMEDIVRHEQDITTYVLPRLQKIDKLSVFGINTPNEDRAAIFSFWIDGTHPHDIATIFDERGIAIRAGHMCAQPMLSLYGKPAAARASFYIYNNKEDADRMFEAIEEVKKLFG